MTRLLFVLVLLIATTACSSSMKRGIRTYDAGAPPRALVYLLEAERDVANEGPQTQARYALYRGLTHLSLGDIQSAERWLAEAKAWMDRDRENLDADDRGRLRTAWTSLGHEPGTWGAAVLEQR